MAVAVLVTALAGDGIATVTPEFTSALNALYATVQDRDRFVPADFRRALTQAEKTLSLR